MPILQTERLTLRELTADDAPFIYELLNDPSFIRNIADRGIRTLDDARQYIENGPRRSYERHGFGLWLMERTEDAAPLGLCGLLQRDMLDDIDIGYALLPQYCSAGYATEAATATMRHAFEVLGAPRLAAVVNEDNAQSIRLLERLGMQYEHRIELMPDKAEVLLYRVSRPST